jgi:uncharacterized membrane protein YgdD (TMEM256/DUF423 family)
MLEFGKGKSPAMLVGTPGLTAPVATLAGSGGIRGAFKIDDATSIWVQGPTVYKVTSAYVSTSLGTIADDSRPVQIAWNGNNLLITSAGSLYSLTLSGSSATSLATGIGMVDSIGDFFVATRTGTNFFIWSDAQPEPTTDPLVFNPLNFKSTNFAADTMVGCKVSRSSVYFFGTKSVEPWYISGGADIPFSRIDGGAFKIGCIAKDSISELDGVFWLGGDEKGAGEVWSISGGQPEKISTPAVDFMIAQWPDKTDAEAFTYKAEGHAFYVLSSTSGNETWVYDITTKEWHQRASLTEPNTTAPPAIPGWNTTNPNGVWTFTNADFTAEAT